MANPYLECNERIIAGASAYLSILVWDETDPTNDISAATALCTVTDENNAVILASGSCEVSGMVLVQVRRLLVTDGLPPGKYRVTYFVTLGSAVTPFQFAFMIDPAPGPQ